MFRAFSCPSSGATTAVAASGLSSELGDSSAVGRGRADQSDHDQHKEPIDNTFIANVGLFVTHFRNKTGKRG